MGNTETETDRTESIRVTQDSARMTVLGLDEPGIRRGTSRRASMGVVTPMAPIAVPGRPGSIRILTAFAGILGTVAFSSDPFGVAYPELIVRPVASVPDHHGRRVDRRQPSRGSSRPANRSVAGASSSEPVARPVAIDPSSRPDRLDARAPSSRLANPPPEPVARPRDGPSIPATDHRSVTITQRTPSDGPGPSSVDPARIRFRTVGRPDHAEGERVRSQAERRAGGSTRGATDQPDLGPRSGAPRQPREKRSSPPFVRAEQSGSNVRHAVSTRPGRPSDGTRRTGGNSDRSVETTLPTPGMATGYRSSGHLAELAPMRGERSSGPPRTSRRTISPPVDDKRGDRWPGLPQTARTRPSAVELRHRHASLAVSRRVDRTIRQRQSRMDRPTPSHRGRRPEAASPDTRSEGQDGDRAAGSPPARVALVRRGPLGVRRRRASAGHGSIRVDGSSGQGAEPQPVASSGRVAAETGVEGGARSPTPQAPENRAPGGSTIVRRFPVTLHRSFAAVWPEADRLDGRASGQWSPAVPSRGPGTGGAPAIALDAEPPAGSPGGPRLGLVQAAHPRVEYPGLTGHAGDPPRRPGAESLVQTRSQPGSRRPRSAQSMAKRNTNRQEGRPMVSVNRLLPGGASGSSRWPPTVGTGAIDVSRFPVVADSIRSTGEGELRQAPSIGPRTMPTLSIRDSGAGTPPNREPHRRRSASTGDRRESAGGPASSDAERDRPGPREPPDPRVRPTVFVNEPPPREADRGGQTVPLAGAPRRRTPPGRYADFSFPSLAPRVDMTTSDESGRGPTAERGVVEDRREPGPPSGGIEDLLSTDELERATEPAEVDSLVARLQRGLDRKRRMDRERRGL